MLAKAKVQLIIDHPFFAALILQIPIREGDIGTIGTNGKEIIYNPSWIQDNQDYLPGVLAHEVLHVALGHIWRKGEREPLRWNAAADFAVNPLVLEAGLELPPLRLINWSFVNQSAEEIYSQLPGVKYIDQPWGNHAEWDKLSPEEREMLGKHWRVMLAQAATIARQKGDLPLGLERLVNIVLYPQVDWHQALAQFLQPTRSDYSFSPPDRRFLDSDIILPDFSGEGIEDIVIAIDTSGSIRNNELGQFLAEVRALIATWPSLSGHLVTCDAAVQEWFALDDLPPIKFKGGGGTDFRPVFKEVAKRGITPSCLIYLTDGAGDFPKGAPYPVLWVVVDNPSLQVPFGGKVNMRTQIFE